MEPASVFDETYEYNAPRFVDFSVPHTIDDKADEFFDLEHEGNNGQYDFMVEPDGQIPEEYDEPEPSSECKSSTARVEERISDVPPPRQEETESVEHHPQIEQHPQETRTNSIQDTAGENEYHTKDNETGHMDHNTEHITDNEKEEMEVATVREEDERIDQPAKEETKEDKELEHVQEPVYQDVPMTTDVENLMVQEEESKDREMPVVEQKTVPTFNEEEGEMMFTQEKDSVEEEKQLEEKQVEVIEKTLVTRDSPESPQMEMRDAEMPAEVVVPSNIVTGFDHSAPAVKTAPKNLVTSWGNSNADKSTNANKDAKLRRSVRRSTRSLNSDVSGLKRASAGNNMQRRSLRIHTKSSQSPALKKRRVSDRSQSRSRKSTPVAAKPAAAKPVSKPFISRLTLPTTPTFMKRNTAKPGAQFKSTEQMEMERIAGFRQQLAARKKQSQASYKRVQESSGYHAVKAVVPPTKPVGFTFETDQRIKEHPMATRQDTKSFESDLRRGKTSPGKVHHGPTVPKPFKLTENRKRKLTEGEGSKDSPYCSMATRIQRFHNKTPQRFHTRRSGDHKDNSMHKEEIQKPRLTCPKTPNLESRNRKRAITVQSAAEKEEQELQEMQSYKFKAKPVNPKLMNNRNIGLKMPTHKEPTKAVGFNLESERRMKERETKKMQEGEEKEEEHYEFHARPVSTKMLEGPVGIGPAKPRTLTCPKSPAFALKNRVRIKEDIVEPEESKSRIIHARPIHHVGVPFKPQTSHKTTDTQPFSFEQRDKEIQARKEAKIQEIYQEEEKARLFKAKPILEPVSVPEKKVKPVTKPEPFHLSNEEQGAKRAEMWSKKIEEELKEQRGMANAFKAKPADVVYNEPFVPQKSNKPLIEINPFNLNTDRRAVEREEFEEWKLKKELQDRESRYQQEKLKEEEERKEVERMRREDLVYRAKPIKHYKPVHVMPSLKPLTDACSPNFSDRFQK
nr:targeting protein for Xklp2 homolog [Lytechinus pictus]